MKRIKDVTRIMRSKNAGPFDLTLEIFFDSEESYREVKAKNAISKEVVSSLYSVPVEKVALFYCDDIAAVKAVIPRLCSAGDVKDTDVFGAQQHGPILGITF